MNKLWGGRFSEATDHTVETYTASIAFDHQLAQFDILGSLAHVAMLKQSQVINEKEYLAINQGLHSILNKLKQGSLTFHDEDEDIHMNVERMLLQEIGEVAGKLHTARSRNDQVALDMHLYLRQQTCTIVQKLLGLREVLLELAEKHQTIIMPAYTHLQRAQPVKLAHYWLAYEAMLARDTARLKEAWTRINLSPLGAAALTGSTFPIDPHYVATLLAFDDTYHNTLDAVSDRDFVIEFVSDAALIMMHLSRLSEELILWSSQEFNFISMHQSFCTGSSIMPQKKNPDVAELGRGKTGRVYGALFSLLTLFKGLPLAYNKDMQEDKEPVFDVIKTVDQTLSIYTRMLASVSINEANMLAATKDGHLNATAMAEYLVKKDLPFRQAHAVIGKMVAYCDEKNTQLEALSLTEMQTFSPLITDDVYHAIEIRNIQTQGFQTLPETLRQQKEKCTIDRHFLQDKEVMLSNVYNAFGL
ncbi:MAG: argininosuccinate lyase [Gammaproteobacteria bacterium]|nr:argininosuccinate lyase [Gammaproteobacteria bacterium]